VIHDFIIAAHGGVYSLQFGSVYRLEPATAYHLPQSRRGVVWNRLASPDGVEGNIIKIGAAANLLFALTDAGKFYQYGQCPHTFLGLPGRWTEIEPVDEPPSIAAAPIPAPPKSRPESVLKWKVEDGARQLKLKIGSYVLVTAVAGFSFEYQDDSRQWQSIVMDNSYRFKLPKDRVVRFIAKDRTGLVELIKEN